MSRTIAEHSISSDIPVLKLPHPYLSAYSIASCQQRRSDGSRIFQLRLLQAEEGGVSLSQPLHNEHLFFGELEDLESSKRPPVSVNSSWARALRTPASVFIWTDKSLPTLGQLWLLVYVLFTVRPEIESFRLQLEGPESNAIAKQLQAILLAVVHPSNVAGGCLDPKGKSNELVVLRSAFWQGAGSPFGPRPVWAPEAEPSNTFQKLSSFPPSPLEYTSAEALPNGRVITRHPRRPTKPQPGSIIYSRYIPHLQEMFSMVALDYRNIEHLNLFHEWQNDPRVSQGWNETGSLEQHREYLRRADEDPHQLTILAQFDGVSFAYFEVYWAKEDHLGSYYDAGDFDRGRHSLVGDVLFRGSHRVSAWWSSLMHYIFLDEPRTNNVVGEPKATNNSVLSYDLIHGFSLGKFVDLPHKRSAFMQCSRERFFQLAPFTDSAKVVGGTGVALSPKL